jgi:hypothetical protein
VLLGACSLLVNRTSVECSSDTDCLAFPGTTCVQGGCVGGPVPDGGLLDISVTGLVNPPCTSTQDCLSEHGGANWVCRLKEQTCVQLTSQDCPYVGGDYTGDDAIILGAILPIFGPHASTGTTLANALKLGLNDFVGGVPSASDGGLPRHVAVVFCDESNDVKRAATHLKDVGLTAILGTGESATTLAAVNGVTFPDGLFLMTPRATVDLSAFQGNGTVWRTCAGDAAEGAALTALAQQVATDVGSKLGLPSVALSILHASDAESTQLDGVLTANLLLNGAAVTASSNASLFHDVPYGDPDSDPNPAAGFAGAITQITTASRAPDVVVVTGSTQAAAGIVGGLEQEWPASAPRRPLYVLSSGLQTPELLSLVAGNENLRARVHGTAPGSNASVYTNLASFLALYGETFPDGGAPVTFGVAQAYDAFYTLVYGATFVRNTDFNGHDLAGGLATLLTPADGGAIQSVTVGPNGVAGALQAISGGKRIALLGASAPLPFDVRTGNVATDVQVWCVLDAQGGAPAFVSSGEAWSASGQALTGSLGNGCSD